MKDRIAAWAERFEAFTLRERGLITATVIVLMFMLWDAALMNPEELKQKQITTKTQDVLQKRNLLNTQVQEMTAALKGGEAGNIKTRAKELHRLLAELKQQQKDLTVEFIQPAQMARVLRDMLSANSGLRLTQLVSLGAKPLFPPEKSEDSSLETKGGEVLTESPRPEIYKHGLRIVFEGDYFKTLKYLQALEAMPWRLYWDNVEYHVVEYPRARVAITVHTLSLSEGWIGV
ncbi:MAG: hypothetical protein COB30_010840 [Ectothiorhodospiraceae bacterium]|nr:hypothetical protein [Ectothiorhodospiraceae bacterium]